MFKQDKGPFDDRLKNVVVFALGVLAGLGVLFSVVLSAPSFADPGSNAISRAAEVIGGLFFAALYVLLGLRPRRYPGVWELALLHRMIIAVGNGILLTNGVDGAATQFLRDVILLALLVGAYVYGRGWMAWRGD